MSVHVPQLRRARVTRGATIVGAMVVATLSVATLSVATLSVSLLASPHLQAQLLTVPELTQYQRTSSHLEVVDFIETLARGGAPFRQESLATSLEGRDIPLLVVASDPSITPHRARREGKLVVYVQGNIHGGEVEGKEVCLMLLRHLTLTEGVRWLDRMVLLVVPIYNCDGNDRWGAGDRHRPNDNGPKIVGVRPNGQGLDLNRDCMKAESPEMQGLLSQVYSRWDPEVVIDLHTTNGTRHGYQLTYSPPLTPDVAPELLEYCRGEMLPGMRQRLLARGLHTFPYGNARPRQNPDSWFTFEPLPRYFSNYAGLRNRLGILSEATSYLPFAERIAATRAFLWELLDTLYDQAERVRRVVAAADREVASWGQQGKPVGIRFAPATRGRERVRLEPAAERGEGAPTVIEEFELEVYDRFQATHTRAMPQGYLIPAAHPEVIALLKMHGVQHSALTENTEFVVEVFRTVALNSAEQLFQGHRLHRLEGEFEQTTRELPAGTVRVSTAQPLALLIFHLLEAESLDGVAAWGLLDRALRIDAEFPIMRCVPRS